MALRNHKRPGSQTALWSLAGLVLFLALCGPSETFPFDGTDQPVYEGLGGQTNEHRSYTETIPGSDVRFDMVAITGGTFWMGSPDGEARRDGDEGPRHPVGIRPFWMGKTEVTWDEYNEFRDWTSLPRRHKAEALDKDIDAITGPSPPYIDETLGFGQKGYPAVGISHHAAMQYCRWLSHVTGKAYRLPTEAEWEHACRAGSRTAYFFGDDAGRLAEFAWYEKSSASTTWPVGLKKPNPWGLHDMYGNVTEWCLDHYQADIYRTFPFDKLTLTPVKLPTADRFPHVVRGGSWADPADRCRSAARRGSDKSWDRDPARPPGIWWLCEADFVGFRVVRAVEEQANLKGLKSKVTRRSKPY